MNLVQENVLHILKFYGRCFKEFIMEWLFFSFLAIFIIIICGIIFFRILQTAESVCCGFLYAVIIDVLLFMAANHYFRWFE